MGWRERTVRIVCGVAGIALGAGASVLLVIASISEPAGDGTFALLGLAVLALIAGGCLLMADLGLALPVLMLAVLLCLVAYAIGHQAAPAFLAGSVLYTAAGAVLVTVARRRWPATRSVDNG